MGRGQLVERVQGGRQVEPHPQAVAEDVLDVPEERVQRGEQDAHGQGEDELDRGDQRDGQDPRAEPTQVEQVDDGQRDQPEHEADRAGGHRRGRQDDLRELDLPDQALPRGDRYGRLVERRAEPLPGQDRGEDEERVIGRGLVEDDRDEHVVDDHLEERVEDPPELAEGRVGMGPLELGAHQVAGQSPPAEHLGQAGPDEGDRPATLGVRAR